MICPGLRWNGQALIYREFLIFRFDELPGTS